MKGLKCRILGTAPGIPVLGKAHSSICVEVHDKNILVDCGEGIAHRLLKYNLDKDFLDAVIITHYHPDHVSGIFMVLQMLYLQKRTKPLSVYLPERIADFKGILDLMYLFSGRFDYPLYLKDINSVQPELSAITIIPNNHLKGYKRFIDEHELANKMLSWSVLINSSQDSLLYSSDFYSGLHNQIETVDYIIVDALHPPIKEILSLTAKTKKQIILTHGLSNDVKKELANNSIKNYIIPKDGYLI